MPSPLIQKLHPYSDIAFQPYKPVFHDRDTPIQLGLLWWSHLCQCLNTKTSAWGNKGYTTETLSISYSRNLYIRLVVIL